MQGRIDAIEGETPGDTEIVATKTFTDSDRGKGSAKTAGGMSMLPVVGIALYAFGLVAFGVSATMSALVHVRSRLP